jgi:hypothetical protein
MKGTFRATIRGPGTFHPAPPPTLPDEPKFFDRPCYEFNRQLGVGSNDRFCEHCRHYLTARCPHIDEFLDDVEDLSPE